jgi:hypothetical protein
MRPGDFASVEPRLVIENYFAGRLRGWGLFEDRFGTVRRQFTVELDGAWDGTELVLKEDFAFKDGETDHREWRLRKTGEGAYEGRAGDVVGRALGTAAGNAMNWRYDLRLKVGAGRWRVRFDDWMFLQDDEVMMSRASVAKWGVTIGTLSMAFRKLG